MAFRRRLNLWLINKIRPLKHARFKAWLFNRIPGCRIGNNSIIVGPIHLTGCSVIIGDNTFIGHDLKCEGNGNIEIGNNCDIAPNVVLLTGSHEIGDKSRRAGLGKTLSIKICDGSWIGANSVILGKENSGLFIGPSSVVGCMSNVIKSVKPNCLVAGNPSAIIKELK